MTATKRQFSVLGLIGTSPILPLLLQLALPAPAQAEGYTYTTNNGTIAVTGYIGPGGPLVIPSTINGLPVTSIGGYFDLLFRNGPTSLTIGSNVTSIADSAFCGCSRLAGVTIPDGVTNIGPHAFAACGSLTNVTIPSSVRKIGSAPFLNCSRLTAITVDALNPSYSSVDGVLFNKSQTKLIEYPVGKPGNVYAIPNTITSIGDQAFLNCRSLTNLSIPNSVTNIGSSAFQLCSGLTSLTIPSSVASIGNQAFFGCRRLTTVTIGKGLTSIGDEAFIHCAGLTGVYFQGNAPKVRRTAFNGATKATLYYLPGTKGWGGRFWGTKFAGRPTALWDP